MTAFSPRYQIPFVVLRQCEKQVVALLSYLLIVVAIADHSSASPPSFLPVVLVASAPCVSFLFLFKYHVSTFEQSWNTLFLIFLECRIIPCITRLLFCF